MADRYAIQKDSLTAIADKIREKKYQDNLMTPAQMIEELDELGYGMDIDMDESCTSEDWVRPAEYPDLSVLDLTDFDGVYLTYDLRKTPGYGWIGIFTNIADVKQKVYIERGHLAGNEFIVDESHEVANNTYFRQDLDETNGNVQIWRVWSDGRILRTSFIPNTTTNANNYSNSLQPCVERYGRLPYATNLSSTPNDTRQNYGTWGTWWLLCDNVKDVVSVTTMNAAYSQCRFLREIHFDGWDTSKVTTFASAFENCWNLKYIPLEHITTDSVTTLANMFKNCRCLDNVDIDHFNIDKVTTIGSLFEQCRSLKHLEMSSWRGIGKLTNCSSVFWSCRTLEDIERNIKNLNVENVTTFAYMFGQCRKLRKLDLSSWNVQKVTNLLQTFNEDYALEVVDVTGWDVSSVTTFSQTFGNCWKLKKIIGLDTWSMLSPTTTASMFVYAMSLESFKVKEWDISALTNTSSMFAYCYSLQDIELDGWDTPNVLTTVASMFSNCRSLKKLYLPNMDFTVSTGVGLNGFLNACLSLEDLDLSNWHIAKINAIDALFSGCYKLPEIDLTSWTVDNGQMTAKNTVNNVFSGLYNCKSIKIHFPLEIITSGSTSYFFTTDTPLEYLDIRNWDISKSTNSYTPNIPTLKEYYPPKLYAVNQTYADAKMLSPQSLVRILEALPTVTAARTITLGQVNKLKLTAEEIAIATNKGWKVA